MSYNFIFIISSTEFHYVYDRCNILWLKFNNKHKNGHSNTPR